MKIRVNDRTYAIPAVWRDDTLQQILRECLGLVGTKYGCGDGLCGACTVLVDGQAVRSCQTGLTEVLDSKIETVEGLSSGDGALHPLQEAWLAEAVPQCGYCQAGQLMSATALLRNKPHPSEAEINTALAGNLCRCGTHQRIRRAVHKVAAGAS